jgi:hypothetical protein
MHLTPAAAHTSKRSKQIVKWRVHCCYWLETFFNYRPKYTTFVFSSTHGNEHRNSRRPAHTIIRPIRRPPFDLPAPLPVSPIIFCRGGGVIIASKNIMATKTMTPSVRLLSAERTAEY